MTKDELDKYLAHLPTRNTRRAGTPPSTPLQCKRAQKTQLNSYKQSNRSSFGVRGPRDLSRDLLRQTDTFSDEPNGDDTENHVDSNKHSPDSRATKPDSTSTNRSHGPSVTTLMNDMNLSESNISTMPSVATSRRAVIIDDDTKPTDTPSQMGNPAISNTGKQELDHSSRRNTDVTGSPTTQPPSRTTQSNETRQTPVYSAQQQPEPDTMPPIPTFAFGNVNTSSNDESMPPIPTFSFGNGDDSHQINSNDVDDNANILNLALGLRCGGCDKLISGMAITAAGHRWHADCFKCQHCHQDLEHVAFYEKDGLPYCALDYHELFTTRCEYCHTPIEEKSIHALGKYYHVGHFFCRECGKPFDEDSTFMEHDGYPYCEKDYLAKFAHKCKGCKEDITNDFLEALDGKWHITCFVCVDCGKAFESNTFYVRNNLPYCERHSRRIKKPA